MATTHHRENQSKEDKIRKRYFLYAQPSSLFQCKMRGMYPYLWSEIHQDVQDQLYTDQRGLLLFLAVPCRKPKHASKTSQAYLKSSGRADSQEFPSAVSRPPPHWACIWKKKVKQTFLGYLKIVYRAEIQSMIKYKNFTNHFIYIMQNLLQNKMP